MTELKLQRVASGEFRLEGELTFKTVPDLGEQDNVLFNGDEIVVCDLNGVGRSDSAGLALLVSWARAARRRGKVLQLRSVPAQLMSLIEVSGLEAVLPLE